MYLRMATPCSSSVSGARSFVLEAHTEFLRRLRALSFSVPPSVFPLLFYVLFGVLFAPAHPQPEGTVLLPLVRWSLRFALAVLGVPLSLLSHPLQQLAQLWSSWHLG